MHDIKVNVKGDGTLLHQETTIRLGTTKEKKRARLAFVLDDTIEGSFFYVKFQHPRATYLKRCGSDITLTVPTEVLTYEGKWLISFIATNTLIENETISGTYAYVSEPHDAVVVPGILGSSVYIYEQEYIRTWIEGTKAVFEIPSTVKRIGPYFLQDYPLEIDVVMSNTVIEIGDHAFYLTKIKSITFPEGSGVVTFKDYAFYRINSLQEFVVPNSVVNYGKYCFSNSSINKLTFEAGSKLTYFPNYAFNNIGFSELELPRGTLGFNTTGQVISDNRLLTKLTLPNTFNTVIQAIHIRNNSALNNIVLEGGWNCSANFSNTELTKESIINMFNALKNLSGQSSKSLTLGSSNLAKVTSSDIQIATAKNWTIS